MPSVSTRMRCSYLYFYLNDINERHSARHKLIEEYLFFGIPANLFMFLTFREMLHASNVFRKGQHFEKESDL